MTNAPLVSDRPALPDLLDQVFSREDWIRLIRRLARSNDLAGLSLLLRCRYGTPGHASLPAGGMIICLPPIEDDDWTPPPPAPPPETGPQALARLLDEALSPADWDALLRRLAHRRGAKGLSLLMQYRYGLAPSMARPLAPVRSESLIEILSPEECEWPAGTALE